MSKPRTVAQRYADYKRTFPERVNDRRCELIDKELPARGEGVALTEAERAELAECTRVVDGWLARAPWTIDQETFAAEQEARVDALYDRIKSKKESP